MHWNIIDKDRYELLKNITEIVSIPNYYMIGGTALSLQLGLRESFDFDFCVPEQFNNELLLEELKKIGNLEVIQNQKGTCDVNINNVQVSFFYYPNKVINEFIRTEEMPKLKIASILDIAVMKITAIGGRGSKKDFFDLYNILNICNISVKELAKGLIEKCGNNINYLNTIMGLSYFEDAENELLPKIYVDYDWDKIKEYFIDFQSKFQESLEALRYIIKINIICNNRLFALLCIGVAICGIVAVYASIREKHIVEAIKFLAIAVICAFVGIKLLNGLHRY